jgi:hypothetical protein
MLAAEYRRAGYDVVINPQGDQLPLPLRQFEFDLIALSPNDNVVIEVKHRRDFETPFIKAIAARVSEIPGWRFEVQFIGEPGIQLQAPASPLTLPQIRGRLDSARLLLAHNDADSALVVAWSAFEAVLRLITWGADMVIAPWNGRRAAKELVVLGVLSRSDYDLLYRGLSARNHVVHGSAAPRTLKPLVRSVLKAVERLAGTVDFPEEIQASRPRAKRSGLR